MKIVPITADKKRNLKFGMNSVIQLEKTFGKPIAEIGNKPSLEDIATIMFFGLKHEDKKLTLEDIGDLMDDAIENHETFDEVIKLVMEAFSSSFGDKKSATPSKK